MGYRLYVVDGSIKPKLRKCITKAIKRSVPKGVSFTGVVATGFANFTKHLGELSKPEHIRKHGHITELIIIAHGDLAGSFNVGRDRMVGHQAFDKLTQPFDAFSSRAQVHVLRCTASGLGQMLSTSSERTSLYRKIGSKLLPRGGSVSGTINDVEFSTGGGVRLTRFRKGKDVPLGGKYPTKFHSLELLLTKPQESTGIDWTYTVRHNDNLTKIARKHGVSVQALYDANRKRVGRNPSLIHKGLKLVIPVGAGGASVTSGQAAGRARVSAATPRSRYLRTRTATRSPGVRAALTRSTLQQGMIGRDVAELQKRLGITADGIYGTRTTTAVKGFQRRHGLKVDGIAGSQTRAKLLSPSVGRVGRGTTGLGTRSLLKRGTRGSGVTALQKRLGIRADGIYGPETQSAVKRLQRRHGLVVDGIVGSQTRAKLVSTSAGSASRGLAGLGQRSVLKRGTRGPDVRTVQQRLGITADGIYGRQTVSAVKRFQRRHGLRVDGIVGRQTRARMLGGSAGSTNMWTQPTLKRGMRGQDVMSLQNRLGIRADGIYGPQTVSAVKRYQRTYGLKADGIFGRQTRNHMLDPVRQADRQLRTMRSPRAVGKIFDSTIDLLRDMERKAESRQQTQRWLRGLQNKFK